MIVKDIKLFTRSSYKVKINMPIMGLHMFYNCLNSSAAFAIFWLKMYLKL